MGQSIDIKDIQAKVTNWVQSEILTYDVLLQFMVLGLVLVAAGLLYKLAEGRMSKAINAMPVSPVIKQFLHNLRRQFFPLMALVLLFFFQLAEALGYWSGDTTILRAAMNLLAAWVVIRMALQFVSNSFMRNLFALTIWTMAALSILGILDNTATALDALGVDIGEFRLSALSVIKALLALLFLMYLAGFLSTMLERKIQKVSSLTITSRVLLTKVVRATFITLALLVGITSAGIDLSLLAVFSGAVGLGVGFGLQKGVSNIFSGMILLMDKSIKPGDVIELQEGAFGWVHHMGARYTEIITRDNKSYLVPNEDFITQQVVNWSHGDTLVRVEVKFGVHYNSDPHLVKKIAEDVSTRPDRVVSEPAPVCHLVEFGDSSLNFALRFWIKDAEKGITNMRGAVMLELWDAFKEHNIAIPYPHREVFIHKTTADTEDAA